MSRARTSGGGASLPVAQPAAAPQPLEPAGQQGGGGKSKSKGKNKRKGRSRSRAQSRSRSTSRSLDDDGHAAVTLDVRDAAGDDDDDPYSTPPPAAVAHSHSTANDPFYDMFAALELKITQGSGLLAQIIRILKQIRVHPDLADRLAEELSDTQQHNTAQAKRATLQCLATALTQCRPCICVLLPGWCVRDDKLSETGALLSEIDLIAARFQSISGKGEQSADEKEQRASLCERVKQDVQQMKESYRQLRAASQAHVAAANRAASSYDPDADDDASTSLLGSSTHTPLESTDGLLYQNREYIGELDGHLAMLEEQSRERAQFMRNIERDVSQVHQLFADMHQLVNEQQTEIDAIEDRITGTQENARAGMEQLLKAQKYQAAKRKKMCCLILMAIIATLLFFLFLWVAFSK